MSVGLPPHPPFFRSFSACAVLNRPNLQAFKLKEHTAEEYEAAFARIDVDGSGFITMDEIATLLNDVFGTAPSDYQIQNFLGYFDANRDGKISLTEFQAGLEVISDKMLAQTKGAAKASGTLLSRKPSTKRVISAGAVTSSYDIDSTSGQYSAAAFGGSTRVRMDRPVSGQEPDVTAG